MEAGMLVSWDAVWAQVASELDEHRVAGLEKLLTEDVVRFATVRSLVSHSVPAADIRAEWRPTQLHGGSIDLALGDPVKVAIEFKFPREPTATNAAWTMHLGEVLKDVYRLAALPATVTERLCVQVVSTRLRRYLDASATKYGIGIGAHGGEVTSLGPDTIRRLPETARGVLGRWTEVNWSVRATCRTVLAIGPDLRLLVHDVEPAAADSVAQP
jgi:hypothetical protein